jgi:cytochrome c551/c552
LARFTRIIFFLVGLLLLVGCGTKSESVEEKNQVTDPGEVEALFVRGGCGGCHVIPGIAGAEGLIGPNLSDMGEVAGGYLESGEYRGEATTVEEFIHESLVDPNAFIPADCPGGHCQEGLMPGTFSEMYSAEELQEITTYLVDYFWDYWVMLC